MKKKLLTLIFTLALLIGLVAAVGMNASAATCPIAGATGAGTEADPIIVDMPDELRAALAYDGTLYIVAKSFPTERLDLADDMRKTSFYEVVSKKVLTLKQDFDVKCLVSGKYSLFSVKDGADFTMIADGRRKIKYTYTVLELAGPTAKATLKGELIIETTTDDGSQSSYALVAHQGNILIDGGSTSDNTLKISSASLKNKAAVFSIQQVQTTHISKASSHDNDQVSAHDRYRYKQHKSEHKLNSILTMGYPDAYKRPSITHTRFHIPNDQKESHIHSNDIFLLNKTQW